MARTGFKPTAYYLLLCSTIGLILLGLIMVLNASSVQAYTSYGDSYYYLKRQAVWAILGLICMAFFSRLDYRKLVKNSKLLLALAILGLILSHVPGIGATAKGASRAIGYGGFTLQPSEPAKLAIILYIAGALAAKRKRLADLRVLALEGIAVLAVLLIILFQPDLGTAVIVALSVLTMLFLGGARLRDVAGLAMAAGVAGFTFAMRAPYRRARILAFINPSSDPQGIGYQIRQSLVALGSGGLTGVGLGMSKQKFFFLPEAHTDFIFAIIGEELGLAGAIAVVIAYGILAYSGLNIAFKTKDYLGKVLGAGLTASIAGQAFVNLGAVTGLLPVTGVPLPLVSSGGSSLVVTMTMLGILMNIASHKGRLRTKSADENGDKRRRDGWSRLPRARAAQGAVARGTGMRSSLHR